MIVWVIFLILLMNLMKNSFSFNERTKTFLFCNFLPSLDCNETLFTTLSTSYADYQRFLLYKLLLFLGSHQRDYQRHFVLFKEKKALNSWGIFWTLGENSQLLKKFSTLAKYLNSWENFELLIKVLGKFSILGKT